MNQESIPLDCVQFFQRRFVDSIGHVFSYQGRIFRGIFPEAKPLFQSLLSSRLLNELYSLHLIPQTWPSEMVQGNFSMLVEHERIWPILYPGEWTISMLKDAALAVLRIAKIARAHGFNMKDCHGFNILFSGCQPCFVDIGSFIPYRAHQGWTAYQEFLVFYLFPLLFWSNNDPFLAKMALYSGKPLPATSFYRYRYPLLRFLPNTLFEKCLIGLMFLKNPDLTYFDRLKERILDKFNIHFPMRACKAFFKFFEGVNFDDLIAEIDAVTVPTSNSPWGDYHSRTFQQNPRFLRILEISKRFSIHDALDIGGNQGLFSKMLLQYGIAKKVICADYDENAIDIGYCRERGQNSALTFAHSEFLAPLSKEIIPQAERFKADAVFVLALLHHLILSQKYSLNYVLAGIARYSKKLVFIEFMPKGLWKKGDAVQVPEWYTLEWFRRDFVRHFSLEHEEILEENRILFVGKRL